MSTLAPIATAAMDASHPLWVPEWVEGEGEKTIVARRQSVEGSPRTLYCSWFCPFAQRAWIALEEWGLDYRYVEVNPYQVDPSEPGGYTKKSLTLAEKKQLLPEFIAASPRGLVPALVEHHKEEQGASGDTTTIWESAVVVEYLQEVYGSRQQQQLAPQLKALVRIYVDHCTSRIQRAYYTVLMEQEETAQAAAQNVFFHECRALACAMAPCATAPTPEAILQSSLDKQATDDFKVDIGTLSTVSQEAFTHLEAGPFFLGSSFSAVDIALAPFFQRFLWVGGHYRGLQMPWKDQDNDLAFQRLRVWWEAVSQRPSVRKTWVSRERLIASYSQYARNVGTSDYATNLQSALTTTTTTKQAS